jgi:hypothetical protein
MIPNCGITALSTEVYMPKPVLMRTAKILAVFAITVGLAAGTLTALGPGTANAVTTDTGTNKAPIAGTGAKASGIPVTQPAAASGYYVGEALWVLYDHSPLRWCPSTSCGVIAYMPATTSLGPGGGWATLVFPPVNGWCEVNWRNDIGYTGCWRLGVLV